MKNQNKKYYLAFSIFFYVLFLFSPAKAQFDLPSIGNIKPTISLTSDSLTPFPNSTVSVVANLSGMTTSGNSNYTWFLNGTRQAEASGLNKNTLNFQTDTISTTYRVSISVSTPIGELSDTINLTVSDFDLTWAANSKAPIFYRAKLIPAQDSVVTISALPFVYRPGTKSQISSNNLIYNWMLDNKIDFQKSGLNKSSYTFRVSNFPDNSHSIRLEIKTEDSAVLLRKEILIPIMKPQIFLYFSDPATNLPYGVALKNLSVKPSNLNFAAQTYFFSTQTKNLKWQWFINNKEVIGETEKPWLAALNLVNSFIGAFSTQIKVTAQNPFNELQIAESITNLEIK